MPRPCCQSAKLYLDHAFDLTKEVKPIPYEFRALVDDFYSGRLVHEPAVYDLMQEPEAPEPEASIKAKVLSNKKALIKKHAVIEQKTAGGKKIPAEVANRPVKPYNITSIDVWDRGQDVAQYLYGKKVEISRESNEAGQDNGEITVENEEGRSDDREISEKENEGRDSTENVVKHFLLQVIVMNGIETAIRDVERDEKCGKSSVTPARVDNTEICRFSKYHEYTKKLKTMEKNKVEAVRAAERTRLENFDRNIHAHGFESIMATETWSGTPASDIPTLDNEPKVQQAIFAINANDGHLSTPALSSTGYSEPKNKTATKNQKKKRAKGKTNAKRIDKQDEEEPVKSAALQSSSSLELLDKVTVPIAEDPLNYDFGDSENIVFDDDTEWETVKSKQIKPKGPRAIRDLELVISPKKYKESVSIINERSPHQYIGRHKAEASSRVSHLSTSTTKSREQFEIESLEDFPAIIPLPKDVLSKMRDSSKVEPLVITQQLASLDSKILVDEEYNVLSEKHDVIVAPEVSKARIETTVLSTTVPKEESISPLEIAADGNSKVNEYNSPMDVDVVQAVTQKVMANEVVNECIQQTDSSSPVSTQYEAKNLKDHAPIYLGDILAVPTRAPRLQQHRRTFSTPAMIPFAPPIGNEEERHPTSALEIPRPASATNQVYMDSILDNITTLQDPSATMGKLTDFIIDSITPVDAIRAIDNISEDAATGLSIVVAQSTTSNSSSLDITVNTGLKNLNSSFELQKGHEEAPFSRKASSTSDNGSTSAMSSSMTVHTPQPQGFLPEFMGLDSTNTECTAFVNQPHDQTASVSSDSTEEQTLMQFSNGWSQQQLSASTILHEGLHTYNPDSVGVPFDCTYCSKHYYATQESPTVLCHGCGTDNGIKYCSIACLLAGSLSHADLCQESIIDPEIHAVVRSSAYQIYYTGPLSVSPSDELAVNNSKYAYRQKAFAMHCNQGPFPKLLAAWARKNGLLRTLGESEIDEANKQTGSYFIFKSSLSSDGYRTNPDSTVICTIKFNSDDHMVEVVARCLRACLVFPCRNEIKEFLFRLLRSYLSSDDSFVNLPHTEDRTTVFYEFQHQFYLESGFHADMQRGSSDKFDFQLEWPRTEYLLSQLEMGGLI